MAHDANVLANVDDVIITRELERRQARMPDYAAENRALGGLTAAMTESPTLVFQKLVEAALELCGGGSAGISVLEPGEEEVFRWRAIAGAYAKYVGGSLPRYFSPCGIVLDRRACVLMIDPVRVFPYLADLDVPACEVLLVPFYQAGVPVGTVWVVAHDHASRFDAEDARVVTSLTKFAEAAVLLLSRIEAAEHAELLRREREEHFRALVTATSDVVYTMNADWTEMHAIDGRALISSRARPIRDWLARFLPEFEHARVRDAIARVVASRQPLELEHRALRSDGSLGWTFARAIPIFNADGELVEWLGTASDISARKLLEEELQRADHKKDEFLATLAHELRNPLAPLSTGISLLGDAPPPPLARKTLGVMRRQLDHMVRLIDDLLDVARIAQGKIELRREHIALTSIIGASLEANMGHFERARHKLDVRLSAEELYLDADQIRMTQVVGNLLNNASKYTPNGGEIVLTTERDGNEVVISVRDSGVGIPRERLEDVFAIFSQIDPARARSQGGLGIGLALVRRLVEMQGGSVTAASEGVGRGSLFTVRLPLARGDAPPCPEPQEPGEAREQAATVLIVDDNEDAAELLTIALENAGISARAAYNAQAAMAAVESAVPNAVVLDIGLPDMNGYELAQRLRQDERFAHTLFIALTGWGTQEDRRKALAAGFDLHLTKPVSVRELREALARAPKALESLKGARAMA